MVALLEPTLELEAACVSEPFYIGETSARVCHMPKERWENLRVMSIYVSVYLYGGVTRSRRHQNVTSSTWDPYLLLNLLIFKKIYT